jgi:hypothetical protein
VVLCLSVHSPVRVKPKVLLLTALLLLLRVEVHAGLLLDQHGIALRVLVLAAGRARVVEVVRGHCELVPALAKLVLARTASIRASHLAVVLIDVAAYYYAAVLVLGLEALLLAEATAIVSGVGLLLLRLLLVLYLLEPIGGTLVLLLRV